MNIIEKKNTSTPLGVTSLILILKHCQSERSLSVLSYFSTFLFPRKTAAQFPTLSGKHKPAPDDGFRYR